MIEEIEISSIQDLLTALDGDSPDDQFWYRGHRNADWLLKPFFQRLEQVVSETTLLTRFRQNAARLLEFPAKSDFDWMFLMQHYGVPTRLLDWSENPLTALYFAVIQSDADDDQNGNLWQMSPTTLNATAGIATDVEPGFIPSFDDEELEPYSIAAFKAGPRVGLKPIATIATRNSARIQAQAGVFTVHHMVTDPLDTISSDAMKKKMVIPAAAKPDIRNQLEKIGVTRFHLFPELESIGSSVREGLS